MANEQVPSFLLGILGREMHESHARLLREVAAAYGHNPEELIRRFLPHGPHVRISAPGDGGVGGEGPRTVRVIKDAGVRNPPPDAAERCMARTWNRGKGGQCTRRRTVGSEYCGQHKGPLRHGRIDEKAPKHVFSSPDNREIHTLIS